MRQAPPLTVWAAGAALAAGVIVLAFLRHYALAADPQPPSKESMATFTRKLLAAPRRQGDLRVLGLGTSLLWAAMPPGQLDRPPMAPWLNWMRLTKSGLGLGALAPALAEIERAPPDVVVIETGLLFTDDGSSVTDRIRLEARQMLKAALLQTQMQLQLAEQSKVFSCAAGITILNAARRIAYADAAHRVYAQDGPDPVLAATLLRLARRGVRIIVLDVPRSAELEQILAADKARWYARLHQALPPGPMLRYQAAPSYQDASLYCDGAHLNGAGSRRFGPWWLAQLVALREGAP
jgi:hypothetical protein